jgi:hypothetical protein
LRPKEALQVDARLIPVNAFIALASPRATSWPNTLFEIGYRLEGLEVPATAAGGRVVIDCLAFDPTSNRFLLGEGKSGNNIEPEQAERYGRVDPADLVRLIGVTLTTPGDLVANPIYVCLSGATERILVGLRDAKCPYPLLSIGEDEISLHGEPASDPAVSEAFSSPIGVDGPPPGLVVVDDQSSDEDYDRIVASALVAELSRGSAWVSCPDLAARAIPYLHLFGTRHRILLVKAVSRAVQRLCDATPDNFRYRGATQTRDYSVVELLDSPERSDPRGRTQRYQAIKSRLTGAPSPDAAGHEQVSLFDEIDLASELDKADTGVPDDEQSDDAEQPGEEDR